jgi:hypothetical protein
VIRRASGAPNFLDGAPLFQRLSAFTELIRLADQSQIEAFPAFGP